MAELTLREAAVALGRSERQVRYMIQQGSLKATKRGLQWVVASEELPLTEVQRREVRERIDRATEAMGRGLEGAKKVGAKDENRKPYSVTALRVFLTAEELHGLIAREVGADSDATRAVHSILVALAQGCHAFHPREKGDHFSRARDLAAACFVDLRLGGASSESRAALALRVEEELVSSISRLLASNDRREKGTSKFVSRFRRGR